MKLTLKFTPKKEKKAAPPLLPCQMPTSDFRGDQSLIPYCPTPFCYFQRLHSCIWSPVKVLCDQREHVWQRLEWSADLLQSAIHHHECLLRASERCFSLGLKEEDASDLWPHLMIAFFKEYCANLYKGKKTWRLEEITNKEFLNLLHRQIRYAASDSLVGSQHLFSFLNLQKYLSWTVKEIINILGKYDFW